MANRLISSAFVLAALSLTGARSASAAETADELAKKLSNPIASLISVPFQQNFDFGGGRGGNGWQSTLNIQPVIPFALNGDWNVISRTILPVIYQERLQPAHEGGIGDVTQSLFLSPARPTASGLIWGIGPVALLPTASNSAIGSQKWAAGPTGVALVQKGPWTLGVLANHLWSFAGVSSRSDVNATYIQPFAAYSLGHGTTLNSSMEASYNWVTHKWSVPVVVGASQIFKVGDRILSAGVSGKYYVVSPSGGNQWGVRMVLTLLFPK